MGVVLSISKNGYFCTLFKIYIYVYAYESEE